MLMHVVDTGYRKRLLKHSSSARVDTDVTARDLVLEIKFTSCKRHRSAESRVRKCTRYACALCGHLILLFGNVHARFYFISVHAVPVQLLIVSFH